MKPFPLSPATAPTAWKRLLVAVGGGLLTLVLSGAAAAADIAWSAGWDGLVKPGRWSQATAEVTLDSPQECRLECSTPDVEGHQATYVGPTMTLPAGTHRVSVPFQLGRPNGTLALKLLIGVEQHTTTIPAGLAGALRPLSPTDRLIVSLGELRSVTALAETPLRTRAYVVVRKTGEELPASALSYAAVDWLTVTGSAAMPEAQAVAIRDWVHQGGRLLVSLPKALAEFQTSPLARWLPLTIAPEPVAVRDLGALEAFSNRNLRIPIAGRVQIAGVTAVDAIALATHRNDPLLMRVPYGFGEVVVSTIDLAAPPLSNWGGVNDLVRRLVDLELTPTDEKTAAAGVRGQLTSTGISDLGSQLGACLDHFPAVRRPSPWWSMVWLLAGLLIVGPLDYVLVHRVLRRPHFTWLTLPLWLLILAGVSASAGSGWNQAVARTNLLDVIDVDAATQALRVNSYATFYSPQSQRVEFAATPRLPAGAASSPGLNWFAIPEASTGGFYRPGGVEWGRTSYQITPETQHMTAVPVLQWSTRSLTSQWTEPAPQVVDVDLKSTGLGRLTGTITHHLPGPVTDWILAYGNRAYWRQASRTDETITPFPPGERFSPDESLVFQGDLRSLLTRVVLTKEVGDRPTETRINREQTRYDPTSRDPYRLWQIITFHEAAGGATYTHLSNDLLTNADLTRQLELGRAVLFGRMQAKSWIATQVNGAELDADRSDVFVRLVLPVRRSGEIVRELPKFGADAK